MAEQFTTNYGFSYYDQYDIGWHTGLNNNFINLDSILNNIEQDIKDIGSQNFIPHTLFTKDSNSDGIPELWSLSADGCTIARQLLASEIYGGANKLQLTISNSSGATKYPAFQFSGLTPPWTELAFSCWLTSSTLRVKLRINDGTTNYDGTYATHTAAERVELTAGIAATATSCTLAVVIEVPDGTANAVVEIQLPMLNAGDKAAGFAPALYEAGHLLTNNLYIFGLLKTNLDCNQRQLQNLRLHLLTVDPASPVRGQLWFDDAAGKRRPRFYDGTNFEDLSVAKQVHEWYVAGSLAVASEVGATWIAPRNLTIEKVYIYCKNPGTAGTTIVDVNKGGTSIFTNQANRPQLAYTDADKVAASGPPDITDLAEGDVVSLDIDQVATGASDLSAVLICR